MSKIARVFHLNKEIQKIYKNGVLQKLFFDWNKYIGEKLNIEKAKGHPSNRISINGKVYQNLYDMKNLTYNYYDTFTEDGYKNINIPELSTGYKVCKSAVNNLIKANTVYTIIIDVRKNTYNKNFGINSDYGNEGYFSKNISIQQNFIGRMIVTATSKETLPSSGQKVFRTQITPDSLGEIEYKLTLLEGDLSQETITENSIKYLKEGCSELRNLTIQGKTYQNLVDINSYQNVTGINLVDNKVEYQTTEKQSVGVINPISIKSNTKYTLITDILDTNGFEKSFIIRVTDENNKYSLNLGSINADTVEKKFLVFTTPSDLTYFKILLYNSSSYAGIKFTFPILLEGDYRNADLPNSIDGIESVTERENINLLKGIKWHDGFLNRITGEIEDTNIDYPNAKYSDLIDIDPNILYITNITQSNNDSRLRIYKEDGISCIQLTNNFAINSFKELYSISDSQKELVSKVRILILDTTKTPLPNVPYLIKDGEDSDKTNINIRVYNYSCESDGIVLPNGVKNTIEEVNGVMNYVQRVGKIIIDGTQVMTLNNVSQTQTSRIYILLDNAKESKGMNNLLCNWYIRNGEHGDYEYIIIQYITSLKGMTLFISVLNSKLETTNLNGIIKYFKENPLSVYYELINPIYNPLYDSKEMINTPILPNGLQDELTLRDSGFKRIQKMNTIILNGSENWSLRVSNDDFSVYNCAGLNILKTSTDYGKSSSKMICEQFAPSDISSMVSTSITKEGICLRQSGTGFILSISNSKLDTQDLAGFKSYLQSNPVTVTYELDTQNIVDTNLTYPFENDTFDITLPLGQKDTIECGYVIKRVWKLTVDNTTTFNFPTSLVKDNTVLISIPVTSITKLYDATVSAICDTLEFKNIYDLDETGFYINKAGNTLYIRLLISDYGSTLSEVTEKLKTNKIVIYYPLLNEIKIPYINKININQPLRSLPNGVCDTIENGKLIQRVGKIIFDGSDDENWHNGYSADGKNNRFQISFAISTNLNGSESRIGYCDRFFIELTRAIPSVGGMRITYSKELLYMLFNPSTDIVPLEDLSAWKTWLSENPVTVYYELANPVETELNLHTISVKEGTNFITTTNNIKPNIQAECLVRCNETNMLNVKEFVGDANVIIDKIKVEKGTTYLFTFTNNLGENDVNNTPNIIVTDKNISIISNTHNTLYGATIDVNLGVAYTYKSGYQFTSNYDYVYITSCNANTTSKNLSDMCLKRV